MQIIKVLGPGCVNCRTLLERTLEAAAELNLNAQIKKVEDVREIIKYGISTPMLVVDEVVKHAGKPLPTVEKIKELLQAWGGIKH